MWSIAQHRVRPATLGTAAAFAAALVLSCGPGEPESAPREEARYVGEIEGRRISAAELDRPIRIALHDLDRDRYEMRMARMRTLLAEERAAAGGDDRRIGGLARAIERGDAAVWIEPPEPPRVDLELSGRLLYGEVGARVSVTVFCDFDVPACASLQLPLRDLVARYPGRVRVTHRDLHQRPGAGGGTLAAAVGCADEQGEIQRYVRAVTSSPVRRGRAGLLRVARELRLDDAVFAECLDSGRQAAWVEESDALARHLGLRVVPTALVNGLYVRGARLAEVDRLVGLELARLGADSAPKVLIAQEAGLTLVGMVRNVRAERSLATIRIAREQRARSFLPGETLVDGILLESVRDDGVFLRDGDRVEFLPVMPSVPSIAAAQRSAGPRPDVRIEVGGSSLDDFRVVGRDEVTAALERRGDLESQLGVGETDAAGRGLLRVAALEPGALYDRIGLEPGDVLVEVDGAPIYAEDNPLLDALARQSRIHLVVRRDGVPWESEIEIE